MALQGTIETFALPEVLRLLGSGAKTGRLRLSGDRGSGSVWIDGGKVVGAEATGARDGAAAVAVLFELLRFADGSFTFEADETTTRPGTPQDIEVLLGDAERQLAEWQEIEAVVPSLRVGLALAEELPGREVVVDATRWKAIVAVAQGGTAGAVADALDLDELDACRRAKDLVEAGLAAVTEREPAEEPPSDPITDGLDAGPVVTGADPWAAPDPALEPTAPAATDAPGGLDADPPVAEPADAAATDLSVPIPDGSPELAPYEMAASAPDDGFDPPPSMEGPSSARADLDAMASGFGLSDPGPDPAYDAYGGDPATTAGGQADTGAIFDTGFGDPSSGFDPTFASDPAEDPAFSFAAPDAIGAEAAPGADLGSPLGAGAALFADDLTGSPAGGSGDGLFATAPPAFDADDTGDAAEVARQLANLSPKAALAVAAAARATTVEEREAALAEVTAEGDEPINRGLLLKFLSSVQT